MTVAGLIFSIAGFLMETVWLFKTSGNPKSPGWLRYFMYIESSILGLAVLSAGLAFLTGIAEIEIPDNVIDYILSGLFLFVIFYGIGKIVYVIMPRVTEHSILVVHFIALISFIQSKPELSSFNFLTCIALPLIIMIWLVVSKKNIPSGMKILLYYSYLLILFVQAILYWQPLENQETCLSLSECFFLGVYCCFYAAHFMFLSWTSWLIFNISPILEGGEYTADMINPYFFDDQISLLPFLIFISSTGGVIYFLYHFQVPQAGLWANMVIIFIVQVLFNPYINSWFKHKLNLVG